MENENGKTNELEFQELAAIHPIESIYGGTQKTRDTSPSMADLDVLGVSSLDGCPATATCLASTQALRSRRVSSASKHLGAGGQSG
jgi:hypothetical protein